MSPGLRGSVFFAEGTARKSMTECSTRQGWCCWGVVWRVPYFITIMLLCYEHTKGSRNARHGRNVRRRQSHEQHGITFTELKLSSFGLFAASLRRRVILSSSPTPSPQGCSALLARSKTLPRKTTALGRFTPKTSRSGAAAAALLKPLKVGFGNYP